MSKKNVKKETVETEAMDFNLESVEAKPSRHYRKGSKYDPLINKFMEGASKLVKVQVRGKDANYIRTQIEKRITARELKLSVSTVNNEVYLEKTQ